MKALEAKQLADQYDADEFIIDGLNKIFEMIKDTAKNGNYSMNISSYEPQNYVDRYEKELIKLGYRVKVIKFGNVHYQLTILWED